MFSKMFNTLNVIDTVTLRTHVEADLAVVYKIFGANFEAKLYWGAYANNWVAHIMFLGEDGKLKNDTLSTTLGINQLKNFVIEYYKELYKMDELTIIHSIESV